MIHPKSDDSPSEHKTEDYDDLLVLAAHQNPSHAAISIDATILRNFVKEDSSTHYPICILS